MFHLLKIEWLKIKNYKAFWIFIGLFILSLFSINYFIYIVQGLAKEKTPLGALVPYNFPVLWQTISWISGWLIYFPGMLMILLITNEFTFKTHRQNIIDGMSRQQFISVKLLLAFILAVLSTFIVFLNVLIFGLISDNGFSIEGSSYLFYNFVQNLNYIFFGMLLAFLLRRSGLAIVIFFLFGFIFEQIIWGVIDGKIIGEPTTLFYFPLQVSDVLVDPPKFFGFNIYGSNIPGKEILLAVNFAYIALYILIMYRKFNKEDL